MTRRSFLSAAGAVVVAATVPEARTRQAPPAKARFRTGLVAYSYRQALQAKTLKRGAEYAGARGLILGVEDDGGITDFAKDTIEIVKRADSPWAGMNLDIGNFRPPAVYDQIEMSIPYAVSTHVKTEMALDDGKTRAPFDLDRVFRTFAAHGFRGYMGLEYEASGDPATAVPVYLRRLKELAVKYSA